MFYIGNRIIFFYFLFPREIHRHDMKPKFTSNNFGRRRYKLKDFKSAQFIYSGINEREH